jgi:hypothetical protein
MVFLIKTNQISEAGTPLPKHGGLRRGPLVRLGICMASNLLSGSSALNGINGEVNMGVSAVADRNVPMWPVMVKAAGASSSRSSGKVA